MYIMNNMYNKNATHTYMYIHLSMNGHWDLVERMRRRRERGTTARRWVAGGRGVVCVGVRGEGGCVRERSAGSGRDVPWAIVSTG